MTIIIAAATFVGLFLVWAVVPTIVKKRHAANETVEIEK